jgi:hypothetical protein
MLYPIMEPRRPSAKRTLVAPPAKGTAALRLPDPDDLPPPYVDTRLVRPETREEMFDDWLIEAVPANPEHGDEHTLLDRVLGTHAAHDRTPSTDLLTHADEGSDFATDLSIRRSGIDPRTGSRYLEELAFEVVNEQSMPFMIARARKLSACGVRRIFAVFVKKQEAGEWSPEQNRFVPLPLEGTIEDRTLVCPVPVRALFDTAAADDALVDALEAKQTPRLTEKLAKHHDEGHAKGHAEGRAEALAAAIDAACDLLGIPVGPREHEAIGSMDANARAALLAHLRAKRRWLDD